MSGILQFLLGGGSSAPAATGDPYFQYNTLLLPGQGTNNTQNNSFLDSGTANSGVGFPLSRSGETTQGTFSPFSGANGNWSNFFSSNTMRLSVPAGSAFAYGTGNFTIEAWISPTTYQGGTFDGGTIISQTTGGQNYLLLSVSSNGVINFVYGTGGGTLISTGTGCAPLNTWTHIALVREGTGADQTKIYANGVLQKTATVSFDFTNTSYAPSIGNYTNSLTDNPFNGYISNLRVVKGVAVYTGNFTPPTAPLASTQSAGTNIAAITGTQTSLLTCQSNRFIDNSTNVFAVTVTGAPAVIPFQPFGAPTSAYSAATNGGSGYFDGTGDYLTATANNAFNFGTGEFTVEGWIYPVAAGTMGIWANGPASAGSFGIAINSSGRLQMDYYGGTSLGGATNVPVNAWSYFAFVRTGNTLNIYLNGVRDATTTTSSNNSTNDFALGLGWTNITTGGTNGYISGFRISDAFARYTGTTMTVPTAPTVNDGNTTVLCNFTNAGVIDNAQDNNLITFADAKISTAQFKWGTSSISFDGTTDYLIPYAPTTNLLAFGSGAFTIEMWFYVTSFPSQYGVLYDSRPASTNGSYPVISLENNGAVYFYVNSANAISSGSGVISTGRWYHLAVVKSGSSTKMFVNGNQVGSTYADTNTYLIAANRPVIGAGGFTLGNDSLNGYIQDLRVTKGYSRYPYNFTAPTAAFPLFWQAAPTPTSDPYFEYTTLLLPGNGTNGAQNNTFLDSSTNNFSITRNGNTTQGTFTPFSQTGWSNYFDGTGDYLVSSSTTAFNSFITGSASGITFTMEAWVYPTTTVAGGGGAWQGAPIFVKGATYLNFQVYNNKLRFYWYDGSAQYVDSGASVPLNTWTYVAVTVNGSSITLYVNGVASGTGTFTGISTLGLGGSEQIGYQAASGNTSTYYGYISNLRVSNNIRTISLPTSALTSDANTIYLTCQNNRFVDNSASPKTFTVNGDTSVQAFSPFNPTASYSTSTVGGSGYFDGSGDYLTSASIGTSIGTGDFSLEAWVYTGSAATTFAGLISLNNSAGYPLYLQTSGNAARFLDFQNPGTNFVISGGTVNNNAWVHIVGTRQSGTIRLFVDGKLAAYQAGVTFNYGTAGTSQISGNIAEYISDSRIVIGSVPTAYQTSSTTTGAQIFTPPTAPLTAVTNTSLLLNYTNGGIIDNTAKNNLETVGGASISTTVSKFGGSSMYFDGTGDWLLMPAGDKFAFGTGDYTVEAWVYFTSITTTDLQIIFLSGSTGGNNFYFHVDGNQISVGTSAAFISNQATSFSTATWYHVAACRYSGTLRLFVNGVQIGSSVSDTTNWISAGSARIGANESGTQTVFGYINDHRVTKGIARYTQNFTPPATAFLTL